MGAVLDRAALLTCPNTQCRVVTFMPGTAGPRCPACYSHVEEK